MNKRDVQYYESKFDPLNSDRQARRKRKPKAHHAPKRTQREILEDIAELRHMEGGLETSYQPSIHEADWLLSSLETFFTQELITDVLAIVKGGKEASVYRCEASPATGAELLAAKVYRPHKFRTIRNDAIYREGRQVLGEGGKAVNPNDHRTMRAIGKKSAFGQQVSHTSWLMHEFATLQMLYDAGASVPRPVAAGENAILMSYHGSDSMPAPLLSEVSMERNEAEELYQEVIRNVTLLLEHGLVHGDLSAYNILYWEGEITLIDFPQVVDCRANRNAYSILKRDLERICQYFASRGARHQPDSLLRSLWDQYVEPNPQLRLADESRLLQTDEEDDDD